MRHPSQTVGTNNQLGSPYLYDAAGNTVADGANYYFYDAENRLSEDYPSTGPNAYPNYLGTQPPGCPSPGVACYFYNAEGQRIAKYTQGGQATTFYIYGTDGEVVADTDGNLNWNETYIHFGGSMIGQYRGSATGFIIKDHLGSTRLDTLFLSGAPPSGCTQPTGATTFCIYDNMDYLPFGEQIAGSSAITHKFTSKERDYETGAVVNGIIVPNTGLDNFGARYMGSSLGRFMSADPGNAGVDNEDPQSWNAYSYAGNNPLINTDPDGRSYLICIHSDDDSKGTHCHFYNKDVDAEDDARESGVTLENGQVIAENGEVIGSYVHFDGQAEGTTDVSFDYYTFSRTKSLAALLRLLFLNPSTTRRQADIDRQRDYPNAPRANNGVNAKIGTNPNQAAKLASDLAQIKLDSNNKDIRVNQEQVNAQGVRVGQNRPDLQYTDAAGIRHYIEYDQDPASGLAHQARILSNDPAGVVTLQTVK